MLNQEHAIVEMINLQNQLNIATNGESWIEGKTLQGKPINWCRCIYMETAELIDSYPWKHWKSIDAEVDVENVRVELVDIWHFLMSLAIEQEGLQKAQIYLHDALIFETDNPPVSTDIEQQLNSHEKLMRLALQAAQGNISLVSSLAEAFFEACQACEFDFEQLYRLYMGKNVLNQFRQDHGYKEGTYIKQWAGKEDNVVMFAEMDKFNDFSAEDLYQALEAVYPGNR
jgi:dimeric dUTPase (all-alpha-NTP-PPase superfamily)